jgi:putative peptidoglycan lipid II flippase
MKNALTYTLLTAFGFVGNLVYLLFLGSMFGAGREMDVLFASATVPQFFEILVLGSLGFALVPLLVREREIGDQQMWRTAGAVMSGGLLFFGVLGVLGSLLAHPIVRITNPGFDAEQVRLGAGLSRLHWLTEVLMAVRVCLTAIHLARGRFVLAGTAPLLGALAALGTLSVLVGRLGITAGAAGLAVSTLVQCLVMWPYGIRGWLGTCARWTGLRPLWAQMAPLVAGAAYGRTDMAFDRFLLSYLPAGTITILSVGNRLVSSLSALTVSGVGAVWLPEMARHSAREEPDRLRALFLRGIEALILAALIVVFLIPAFGGDLLGLLFRRGQFSAGDVQKLTEVVLALAGLYVAGTIAQLTANTFYAQRDTRTPSLLNAAAFTLSIGFRLLGLRYFGLIGIAAASSAGALVGLAAHLWVLRRRWRLVGWRSLSRMVFVYGTLAAVCVTSSALILHGAAPWARAIFGIALAALLFITAALAFGGDVPRAARAQILSRFRRTSGSAGGGQR